MKTLFYTLWSLMARLITGIEGWRLPNHQINQFGRRFERQADAVERFVHTRIKTSGIMRILRWLPTDTILVASVDEQRIIVNVFRPVPMDTFDQAWPMVSPHSPQDGFFQFYTVKEKGEYIYQKEGKREKIQRNGIVLSFAKRQTQKTRGRGYLQCSPFFSYELALSASEARELTFLLQHEKRDLNFDHSHSDLMTAV